MPEAELPEMFGRERPVIGVIHAPALPGAPGWGGDFEAVRERVRSDAAALADGGADGVLLENYGDAPFHPGEVPPETVSHLTALARDVATAAPDLSLGANVLRNDPLAALAVASASGGAFIRVNVLAGARVADQGLIQGRAHRLLRRRRDLEREIGIFADVDVKHSAPLSPRPLEEEARELVERAGADALIVTGAATGEPPARDHLERIEDAAAGTPVLAGSGARTGTVADLMDLCDGVIVGSALRTDGRAGAPVDADRVRALVEAARTSGPDGGGAGLSPPLAGG